MNNNRLNNRPDWVWVLGCKDLLPYFRITELRELSCLCRSLRNNFKPYLFNHLDLTRFNPRDKEILNQNNRVKSSTSRKPMDKVQLYFKPFVQYISGLQCGRYFTNTMLLTLPGIFDNLKNLELYNLVISLFSLHQLIHKLNSLETLVLDALVILIWPKKKPSLNQFKFPETLQQLAIVRCQQLTRHYNPKLFNESADDLIQSRHTDFCHFPGQLLPNLQELIINELPSGILMQNEFLSLNPQLTSIQTGFDTLNQASFDYLNHLQYLTHLLVAYLYYSLEDFNQSTIPTLNRIKHLIFIRIAVENIPSIVKLCSSCPNTTHLTVPFIPEFGPSLNKIVLGLKHLQEITIVGQTEIKLNFDMELLWNQLNYIQLQWFDPLKIDLTKFEGCTKLKRVTIRIFPLTIPNMDKIRLHFNKFKRWNCLYFHKSVQCYKI